MIVALAPAGASAQARGFDPALLDRTVSPCEDFNQYACGGWLARNPVPPGSSAYGRSDEVEARNDALLFRMVESAARPRSHRTAVDQKIGDDYASCLDTATIDRKGLAVLDAGLREIAGIKNPTDLARELGRLHAQGVRALFDFTSREHFGRARPYLAPSAMALGDPDAYRKDDPRHVSMRAAYRAHVKTVLALIGDGPERAEQEARTVLDMETALAAAVPANRWDDPPDASRAMRRRDQMGQFAAPFDWNAYFAATHEWSRVALVEWPEYFEAIGRLLQSRSPEDWQSYLRWRLAKSAAGVLPAALRAEDAAFRRQSDGRTATEARTEWCRDEVKVHMAWALAGKFVAAMLDQNTRSWAVYIVESVAHALDAEIASAPWMSDATRERARHVAASISLQVGGPNRPAQYAGLLIRRGDAFGNWQRASAYAKRASWDRIEQVPSAAAWPLLPTTVNARFIPGRAAAVFPAALLQPPFLDVIGLDDAVMYGGLGTVAGHELIHAFEASSEGREASDWAGADRARFDAAASCLVDQFSAQESAGRRLDGLAMRDENVADAGGLRLAYVAFGGGRLSTSRTPGSEFSAEQRFFLAFAQASCSNETEESLASVNDDPTHAPSKYRVNVSLSNMPEFANAFSCPAGSKMVHEPPCRVW